MGPPPAVLHRAVGKMLYIKTHGILYTSPMIRRVLTSAVELRRQYGPMISAVETGEHRVLARHNRMEAVIVPMTWYRESVRAAGEPEPTWQLAGVEKLRVQLKDLIGEVNQGRVVIITRYGEEAAAMVPLSWYRAACLALGEPFDLGPIEASN